MSRDTEYTEDSYSGKCIFQLCNSGSLGRFFSFIHIWVVLALNYHILEEFGLESKVKPTSPSGAVWPMNSDTDKGTSALRLRISPKLQAWWCKHLWVRVFMAVV